MADGSLGPNQRFLGAAGGRHLLNTPALLLDIEALDAISARCLTDAGFGLGVTSQQPRPGLSGEATQMLTADRSLL